MSGPTLGRGESTAAIVSGSTGVAAGALAAVGATCCVSPVLAPIIVSLLGASGAVWAARVDPYGWWILGAAFAALALGFLIVYGRHRRCAVPARTRGRRLLQGAPKIALWVGAACWTAGVILRLLFPS